MSKLRKPCSCLNCPRVCNCAVLYDVSDSATSCGPDLVAVLHDTQVQEDFLTSFDVEVLSSLETFTNRVVELLRIATPALISLALCPVTLYLYQPLVEVFWPGLSSAPDINEAIACFLAPAGLVYATSFGFAFQQALSKQSDILYKVTYELGLLDQIVSLAAKLKLQSREDRMEILRCVKSEAVFMALQIENRQPGDFRNKPKENVKDSFEKHCVNGTSRLCNWMKKLHSERIRPNVLFIVADDMRPEIRANANAGSPWLEPTIVTPNLDNLASRGMLFRRAYCQFAWCNPSRSSFLTSRRPDTTMVHNNSVYFRQNNPHFISLPQFFKQNGYLTLAMGKIFHNLNVESDSDYPCSWDVPAFLPYGKHVKFSNGKAWEAVREEDRKGKLLMDEYTLDFAKQTLNHIAQHIKSSKQPFFCAFGLKKPHFNFEFPASYLNNYQLNNITMPVNPIASSKLPDIAWFTSFEMRNRKEYMEDAEYLKWSRTYPLAEWITRDLRKAYYSCISYIDDLIGQLITHLEQLGLADNTLIAFIGDHGFHLGEHGIVGKNTAFEVANNAPMIIRIPGVTDEGLVTDKLVEFVDLFPTLAELAGLPPVPYCPPGEASRKVDLCTEGTSLVPLFHDPSTDKWKNRVFFQYPHYKGYRQSFCMGYSMRTERYRYTEWVDYDYERDGHANWTNLCAAELYDHQEDPHEMKNIAEDPLLSVTRYDLSSKLRAGWTEALQTVA